MKNRCLVPWTAFCEYEDTKPKKTDRWFAINDTQPLAFFAGIWTPWKGARGSMKNPRVGEHELFAFLTCEANSVVKPIHPKAMPVILTEPEEIELWLTADWKDARMLQRPISSRTHDTSSGRKPVALGLRRQARNQARGLRTPLR